MNRGLTREQAEAGVQSKPLTKAEWRAMHIASLRAEYDAVLRTYNSLRVALWRNKPPQKRVLD